MDNEKCYELFTIPICGGGLALAGGIFGKYIFPYVFRTSIFSPTIITHARGFCFGLFSTSIIDLMMSYAVVKYKPPISNEILLKLAIFQTAYPLILVVVALITCNRSAFMAHMLSSIGAGAMASTSYNKPHLMRYLEQPPCCVPPF